MVAGVLIIRRLLGKIRVRVGVEAPLQFFDQPAREALRAKRESIKLPSAEEEISEDALLRAERKNQVTDYIRQKPTETSRLLKVWLAED
jgi:flagellar biosynthesis/type III secretory pathway M-ring protein FliF/YscJ